MMPTSLLTGPWPWSTAAPYVISPGEFLENRRFYSALITTAAECDILLMFQDATRNTSLYPPNFATMFNRRVLGVISHAQTPGANVPRARRFLHNAGVANCLAVHTETGLGLDALKEQLQ